MARRHYLVAYDISDDKRRTHIFRTLEGYGDHVQYSVFLCELSNGEHVTLQGLLGQTLNAAEDQVMILDLGGSEAPLETALEFLGRPYEPPCRIQVV